MPEGTIDQAATTPPAAAAPAAQGDPPQLPEGDLAALVRRLEAAILGASTAMEERARTFLMDVPGVPAMASRERKAEIKALMGRWTNVALTAISGEKVPDMELRALADVITADNLGVVPKNIRDELIGIIDPSRPFLESTTEVDPGDSGMVQTFPRITQRPVTAVQAAEKAELASQKTIIGTVDFGVTTIGGAGDLSIQLLKRSSPTFLGLWLQLLAEQYAIDADDLGVDALLAAVGVQVGTGVFDPETFLFGESFTNAGEVSKSALMRPNRMWLSTQAYVAMVDARTPAGGGGTPMYPGLVALEGVTDRSNGGPAQMTLRPVLTPSLDDEAVDVIIGPSRGFAWAEDGTYTLQADVPSKAGRDVGLVGMIWYMPIYPAAFTTYALA
jgi:hypothetical protein